MAKKLIGASANKYDVYTVINNEHMIAHKDVSEDIIKEAISQIELKPPFAFYTVNLGRVIGKTNCVVTTKVDEIRWECRPGRETKSRMVYDRQPEDTCLLTIGICTDDDGLETVFTAFYGELAPKELTDPRLTEKEKPISELFWKDHAIVAPHAEVKIKHIPLRDEPVHFEVNGIEGDVMDFGDIATDFLGRRYLDIDDPSLEICEKYRISTREFLLIADRLDNLLQGWWV